MKIVLEIVEKPVKLIRSEDDDCTIQGWKSYSSFVVRDERWKNCLALEGNRERVLIMKTIAQEMDELNSQIQKTLDRLREAVKDKVAVSGCGECGMEYSLHFDTQWHKVGCAKKN